MYIAFIFCPKLIFNCISQTVKFGTLKLRNFTINFVAPDKEKKSYPGYYVNNNGKGESYNFTYGVGLSPEQLYAQNGFIFRCAVCI